MKTKFAKRIRWMGMVAIGLLMGCTTAAMLLNFPPVSSLSQLLGWCWFIVLFDVGGVWIGAALVDVI